MPEFDEALRLDATPEERVRQDIIKVFKAKHMLKSFYNYFFLFRDPSSTKLVKVNESAEHTEEPCTTLEVCRISVTPNNIYAYAVNRIVIEH